MIIECSDPQVIHADLIDSAAGVSTDHCPYIGFAVVSHDHSPDGVCMGISNM